MLTVKSTNYTNFKYSPYLERGQKCEAPKKSTYHVGDVVLIIEENAIGVVLGCIDEKFDGDVRTDMSGMVSIDDIRHATIEDFNIEGVRFEERLREDCMKEKFLILANSILFQNAIQTEVVEITAEQLANADDELTLITETLSDKCQEYNASQRDTLVLTKEDVIKLLPILQKFINDNA